MKRRFALTCVLSLSLAAGVAAQEAVRVVRTDGTSTEYKREEVKGMSFGGDEVRIHLSGGDVAMQADDVREVMLHTNHDYVDLGLSVKWATCNIGAGSPEEYGDYYAWGEVATKDTYTGENSLTYGKSFSDLKSMGIIDDKGNLTPAYDAASANWGGSWRMPTSEEIDELLDKCSWTWTTMNGNEGYRVTGTNGNSIFLPACGWRCYDALSNAGSNGGYWSGSPGTGYGSRAYGLYFYSGFRGRGWYGRGYGLSVRPVCP